VSSGSDIFGEFGPISANRFYLLSGNRPNKKVHPVTGTESSIVCGAPRSSSASFAAIHHGNPLQPCTGIIVLAHQRHGFLSFCPIAHCSSSFGAFQSSRRVMITTIVITAVTAAE